MEKSQTKKIIISCIAIVFVAVLGSIFVFLGQDWFNSLQKPTQWIPNIVIPIVWTIVYLAFAVINFIWLKKEDIPTYTIVLMIINGILNILWCLVFFTLKQLLIGNVVILLNLIAGFVLIVNIYKYKRLFGYILCIYPLWLCVAASLNLTLWVLN
ncbi:MAG: tryptophan-rich sensory protein [Clostridia bacterium]|nr:tryptophan-rich sensory protein [Clostridia bacterium]